MSDPVAIALINGVISVVTLVTTVLTRRSVKKVDKTVKDQHQQTRVSLAAAMCRHPADVDLRSPSSRTRSTD